MWSFKKRHCWIDYSPTWVLCMNPTSWRSSTFQLKEIHFCNSVFYEPDLTRTHPNLTQVHFHLIWSLSIVWYIQLYETNWSCPSQPMIRVNMECGRGVKWEEKQKLVIQRRLTLISPGSDQIPCLFFFSLPPPATTKQLYFRRVSHSSVHSCCPPLSWPLGPPRLSYIVGVGPTSVPEAVLNLWITACHHVQALCWDTSQRLI